MGSTLETLDFASVYRQFTNRFMFQCLSQHSLRSTLRLFKYYNHRYQGVRHKSMKARHTNVYHKFFIKC